MSSNVFKTEGSSSTTSAVESTSRGSHASYDNNLDINRIYLN